MTPPSQQPPAAGHPDPGRLMRFATYASVTAAAVLIAAKLVAWSLTGSVAVLSTLVDSLLDLLARSEEHTSELQSLMRISYAVFCLKKKKTHTNQVNHLKHNYTNKHTLYHTKQ